LLPIYLYPAGSPAPDTPSGVFALIQGGGEPLPPGRGGRPAGLDWPHRATPAGAGPRREGLM